VGGGLAGKLGLYLGRDVNGDRHGGPPSVLHGTAEPNIERLPVILKE
jgi:hypothetical protein